MMAATLDRRQCPGCGEGLPADAHPLRKWCSERCHSRARDARPDRRAKRKARKRERHRERMATDQAYKDRHRAKRRAQKQRQRAAKVAAMPLRQCAWCGESLRAGAPSSMRYCSRPCQYRDYRERNQDAIAARARDSYERHRDAKAAANWAWRQRNAAHVAAIKAKRRKALATLPAPRRGDPWAPAEDAIASRADLTTIDAAAMLGRSVEGVKARRRQLRRAVAA
ncbi:endonuclease [Mycobacterium phage DS6A]|uniref:Uncharacterized protein n=1 Tax=Mycobacterium phage DS6A TaxID=45764 RepID=G8I4G0_9CAUD|nr:endonuclease [Mycobacterium phage DS6A]AER47604.1 hypothetical protein DS6A_50 [Mycobacterium phage DS6A]